MRLLHQRNDHGIRRVPCQQQEPDRGADQAGACQQSLPLRDTCSHHQSGQACSERLREVAMNIQSNPSRRSVLRGGGALVVSFSLDSYISEALAQGAAPPAKPLALTEVDSYLVIDAKGAVTLYSGKVDLGTGLETALSPI